MPLLTEDRAGVSQEVRVYLVSFLYVRPSVNVGVTGGGEGGQGGEEVEEEERG